MTVVLSLILWTFFAYWIHRFSHTTKWRWLRRVHAEHHKTVYGDHTPIIAHWTVWLFWFGNIKHSLNVYLTITLPAVLAAIICQTWWVLVIHYFYEVICADGLVDHNDKLTGKVWAFFGVGSWHMDHHRYPLKNYGFGLSIWDKIWGTEKCYS